MSSIVVSGDTSGAVTLSAPAVAGTVTVTLPSASGTMAVTGGSPSFTDITATGNLTVNGNTTLGDANTDTVLLTGAPSIGGAGYGMGMGFRNRIINGAMVIDQRNAGASVSNTTVLIYTLDRWGCYGPSANKFTVQQSSTVPSGFINSLLATSSAATSVGASDIYHLFQQVEGLNVSDLGWGTASAQTVTLSFQVRSSLTGTFGGSLRNSAGNRSYPFTYTISAANTWETKSITIAGDTTGTWLTTNGIGISLSIGLGVGSTYSGTSGAWAAGNYLSATGATSVVGTSGATFYITGVQLEKGSTATAFDYRPYGTELALCQRYYWSIGRLPFTGNTNYTHIGAGTAVTSTSGYVIVPLPVTMRTSPGLSVVGPTTFNVGQGGYSTTSISADILGVNSVSLSIVWAAGGTFSLNSACRLYTSTSNAELQFSAEL